MPWITGRVYLRHFDSEGRSSIVEHQCWDTERFLESTAAAAMKEGGGIEVLTQDEYRAATWPQPKEA